MKTYHLTTICGMLTILCLTLSACSTTPSRETAPARPQTFCIALDLSDRLLNEETVRTDSAVIQEVFTCFENAAKQLHYIGANDKFLLQIVPQKSLEDLSRLEGMLELDLAKIPMKRKLKAIQAFKAQLPDKIRAIYQTARKPSPQAYSGADVWKFLNTELPQLLDTEDRDALFHLVVLTDGYLELDDKAEMFERGGRANHLHHSRLRVLREKDLWRTAPCDILLLPDRLCQKDLTALDVTIAGLHPKSDYPFEVELLEKIWNVYLTRMNVRHHLITYMNEPTVVCRALSKHWQEQSPAKDEPLQ